MFLKVNNCTSYTYIYSRADGKTILNTTVPDTITSWIATAFAINKNTGLGITKSSAKVINMSLVMSKFYIFRKQSKNENTTSIVKKGPTANKGDHCGYGIT